MHTRRSELALRDIRMQNWPPLRAPSVVKRKGPIYEQKEAEKELKNAIKETFRSRNVRLTGQRGKASKQFMQLHKKRDTETFQQYANRLVTKVLDWEDIDRVASQFGGGGLSLR